MERSLCQRLLLQAIQSAAGKLATLAAGSRVCKSINNVQQVQTDIFVSSISSTISYKISTLKNNLPVSFVLETGAAVTILHKETWENIKMPKSRLTTWTGQNFIGVEGTLLQAIGCSKIPVEIEGKTFYIKVIVVSSLTTEAIM